jgi:HSF-type DNA-binding
VLNKLQMDSFRMSGSGGLSHLVEAATALAGLTSSAMDAYASKAPVSVGNELVVVSDEDDKKCAMMTAIVNDSMSCNKRQIFPQRLLAILSDPSLSEIVTWLPHGKSFVIVRPDVFTEKVLPLYLPPLESRGSTKYASFTRKLNRW